MHPAVGGMQEGYKGSRQAWAQWGKMQGAAQRSVLSRTNATAPHAKHTIIHRMVVMSCMHGCEKLSCLHPNCHVLPCVAQSMCYKKPAKGKQRQRQGQGQKACAGRAGKGRQEGGSRVGKEGQVVCIWGVMQAQGKFLGRVCGGSMVLWWEKGRANGRLS